MSAEPLTPKNAVIVVACAHQNQAHDAMAKYGPEVTAKVTMHICVSLDQAETAKGALPNSTPWTIMSGASPYVIASLQAFFGAPRNFSYAIEAQNNEYAIHHRKLTQAGA